MDKGGEGGGELFGAAGDGEGCWQGGSVMLLWWWFELELLGWNPLLTSEWGLLSIRMGIGFRSENYPGNKVAIPLYMGLPLGCYSGAHFHLVRGTMA